MSEADDATVIGKFSQAERERGLTGLLESSGRELFHWEQTLR